MGWYNRAYCTDKSSSDSRKQSVVKQLPFAIAYWAGFPSQLTERTQANNPKPNPKQINNKPTENHNQPTTTPTKKAAAKKPQPETQNKILVRTGFEKSFP